MVAIRAARGAPFPVNWRSVSGGTPARAAGGHRSSRATTLPRYTTGPRTGATTLAIDMARRAFCGVSFFGDLRRLDLGGAHLGLGDGRPRLMLGALGRAQFATVGPGGLVLAAAHRALSLPDSRRAARPGAPWPRTSLHTWHAAWRPLLRLRRARLAGRLRLGRENNPMGASLGHCPGECRRSITPGVGPIG